jgi:hypothetical protein
LGPRTQHMAHMVLHFLRQTLVPGCIPLFTSDGLKLSFSALTAHFGQWLQLGRQGRNVRRWQWQVEPSLISGQVKKSERRRKLTRVTPVIRLGTEPALKAALQGLGLSGRLNTACIERVNLTVRHGVAALARRTWATSQQSPHLLAHLEWWRAYSHVVRPHQSLRVALVQPRERGGKRLAQCSRQRTPAMAAGRTQRRWTARCSLAPCRRLPLERHLSLMWEECHVARKSVKVPAEEVGWGLTLGKESLSGLPHDKKPARRGFVKCWSNYPPCPMAGPTCPRLGQSCRAYAARGRLLGHRQSSDHPTSTDPLARRFQSLEQRGVGAIYYDWPLSASLPR